MDLKERIKQAFINNNTNQGEIEDIAKALVNEYKISVEESFDAFGNKPINVNYTILEKSIISQFKLSLLTKKFLTFNLIDGINPQNGGLIAAWSGVPLRIPAIPPPGFAVVLNASVVSSTPSLVSPIIKNSSDYDTISQKFFDLFTKHAKTISIIYNGTAPNGNPISITTTGITIQ